MASETTLGKNRVWVTKHGVERWVSPAIEHAQDVSLVGETRSEAFFMVSFCRVSFCVQFLVSFLLLVFLFFVSVLFSKIESFGLGLSFDFFVFFCCCIT